MRAETSSRFFDRDDFLALVRAARQAGVVRPFRLMALGTDGQTLSADFDLGRPSFVTASLRMLMFGIRHSVLPRSPRQGGHFFFNCSRSTAHRGSGGGPQLHVPAF